MFLSAMKLTLSEGARNEALPAPTVMTKRIEPSRKHGPFDTRWPSFRRVDRLEEARLGAIMPAALQAWEGEGDAVLQGERQTNPTMRARPNADAVRVGGAFVRPSPV
jgi:hypothetical protein